MPSSEYEYIDKYLAAKKLKLPELKILEADSTIYNTLLFQPKGTVEVSIDPANKYIRSQSRKEIADKFRSFFNVISTGDIALAASPEYSCPWENIKEQIVTKQLPKYGAVWAIGCESITPPELITYIEHFKKANVTVICEKEIYSDPANKFYDPVCIFFKTYRTQSSVERNVVIIQFKTRAMGGTKLEEENLILGRRRYIVRNNTNESIFLAVIICSESLDIIDITKTFDRFRPQPYLLLHLQMNLKSKDEIFKNYRTIYFQTAAEAECDKELICLNWADGTKIVGGVKGKGVFSSGGSAIYFKDPKLDDSSERIDLNDRLGLVYNHWAKGYSSIFQFAPIEGLFSYENYKVSQYMAVANSTSRTGPKMLDFLAWKDPSWKCDSKSLMNFSSSLAEMIGTGFKKEDFEPILDPSWSNLDKERLILITTGEACGESDWHVPRKLRSLNIESNEFSNRLTFLYEKTPVIAARKRELFVRFSLVNRNLKDPAFFPEDVRFTDFRKGCKLAYSENYNLLGENNCKAIYAHIGEDIDNARAEKIKRDLIKIRMQVKKGMQDSHDRKLVIVTFTEQSGKVVPVYEFGKPTIDEIGDESPDSFLRAD